jgi:glycosyltransferase involved in cell wall biosynthesis
MLVAALRVKNETWVIRYTLAALSEFVDKIVVIDDGSTDDTVEVCREFPKVVEIFCNGFRNENRVDEARDWNRMTTLARRHGAEWILYTDADEMLEPAVKDFVRKLPELRMYDMIRFRKVSPWKGIEVYRTDKARFDHRASDTLNPIIARAACQIRWHDGRGGWLRKLAKRIARGERALPSLGRGFPDGVGERVLDVDDLVSVHFNHLSMDRLARKQVFYALVEKRMKPYRSREDIVQWVSQGWSEEGIRTAPVKPEWLWQDYLHHIDKSDCLRF